MLATDLVVGTDDRSLEQREDAFDRISMNLSVNPLKLAVRDGVMLGVMVRDSVVGGQLVCVVGACRVIGDILDELVNCALAAIADDAEADPPAALNRAHANFLVVHV